VEHAWLPPPFSSLIRGGGMDSKIYLKFKLILRYFRLNKQFFWWIISLTAHSHSIRKIIFAENLFIMCSASTSY
jgi:hypothetical protein